MVIPRKLRDRRQPKVTITQNVYRTGLDEEAFVRTVVERLELDLKRWKM